MTKEPNTHEDHDESEMQGMAVDVVCHQFSGDEWVKTSAHVPNEMEFTLYVNRQELVTILCTPSKLNYLIIGFLYGQGIISSIDEVLILRRCEEERVADVRLNVGFEPPAHRTLTSGCGGGSIFYTVEQRVESGLVISPAEVLELMKKLQEQMDLYRFSGGVHTSALADNKEPLIIAEDIGRHNTLDKILGECLVRGISTKDRLLLCTGRISSEMLFKAAAMQVPIVVSRHSPTGKAVTLAGELGITLVGRARGGRLVVYSRPERLGCAAD